MDKITLSFFLAMLLSANVLSQNIISQFDFNSIKNKDLKKATIGPNASDISTDVDSDGSQLYFQTGGASTGVDLDIAYGTILDVGSIELEFQFRKNENNCYFFERQTMSAYCLNGYLYFTYRTSNGEGGYTDITIGSASAVANHAGFKSYIFAYDAAAGIGAIKVDGTIVASYDGPNSRSLYWTGASGTVTMGREMDGGGSDTRFLDWVIIRDGISSPLPVELTAFTASTAAAGVMLRWKTATEANNYGFEVQRSVDRSHWTAIGFVEGHGTTNAPQSYQFQDPGRGISTASVLYRLKQIDRDGTYAFSNTISVAPDTKSLQLANYPNPFNPVTNIRFALAEPARVTLDVYNEIGQLVIRLCKDETLDTGAHIIPFDGSKYAAGSYFARLTYGGKDRIIRMVLVK